MKIAFVGKGGSGKTTISTLFIQYAQRNSPKNIWAIDADLNMHLAEQLGLKEQIFQLKHISSPESEKGIKTYLLGSNNKIKSISHFKKSTPPTKESNFILPFKKDDYILSNYSINKDNLYLSIVGAYYKDGIGASCYHNNLAVLESILSHTIDKDSTVVVDMVAGIDAFASTLHAQFDMIVIVVESTRKSLEVYEQYKVLSEEAGIWDLVYVIGNKVITEKDKDFIQRNVKEGKLLGYIGYSEHIKDVEQDDIDLDINRIEGSNIRVLDKVVSQLKDTTISYNERLNRLYKLHSKYVAQEYIKDRFGDLSDQIDQQFNFDEFVKKYHE